MNSNIKTTYAKLPSIINNLKTTPDDIEENIITNDRLGDDQIITYGPVITIKDLGISVIEGVYYCYNPDTEELEPDFSLTLIYDTTETDALDFNSYAYFEQDSMLIAIHNYLDAIGYVTETKPIIEHIQLKQYAYAS